MTQTKYSIALPFIFKFHNGYNIRVFISGDYEFLSPLYGFSGASGMLKAFFKLTNTIHVTHLNIGKQPCL